VIADELEADWSRVRAAQAPGDEARYGNQDTDGSRSLRHFYMPMRRAGAAARAMLEQAAASRWGVPVSEVRAENHAVLHQASGRSLGYGELAKDAAALPVPERDTVRLKEPGSFRYIGTDKVGLIDNRDITTGKAGYGIDMRLDGMLYAVVARPPVFGGKVARFDAAETMKVPGVVKVVEIEAPEIPSEFAPLGGIAVVARNTWAAIQGRERLEIEWEDGPNAGYSSDAYRAQLEEAARKPGKVVRAQGDVDKALAGAAERVEAEYYIPHLAQAPMEPPSAVVRIADVARQMILHRRT
jgi:isoquinoline 1-oxidoreductase subunit beta